MKNKPYLPITILLFTFLWFARGIEARERYNFNSDWNINGSRTVTLPRAFNQEESFRVSIDQLSDTVVWYRKTFRLPQGNKGKKVFIEFEGVRQAAEFYLNGHKLGLHENGVMAVGFDLTPYIKYSGTNEIALRIDNDWMYREKSSNSKFQWNDRNFNANYGGIPKNVWLHITEPLYQTLPLYSSLKTTGVYVYADQIQVKSRRAVIHAESEVKNEFKKPMRVSYQVEMFDKDNRLVTSFTGEERTLSPKETATLRASAPAEGLHFWSWGYGYLYTIKTQLKVNGKLIDEVSTRTGFRKTRFAEGKVWLNDRVIQLKGYAQRTSNEWPAVGMSVPAWLSDYSNHLMVESNANLVRWMHITPWKQDVESCDRVGLIQAMPAGDSEKDRQGRQWEHRTELMRDAIIYNRNNPSILFYECGNESVSAEHMEEMKTIRDQYDPYGGRAIGSREMLDIRTAEYGGEMLYINKSKHHPMWAMEYCRDEGLRKYWDEQSYPYHKQGDGPLHKGQDASIYNHNQDQLAISNLHCWYDYFRERPGTGLRVSSGGVKIIFSDTNTHFRGAENYRRSGVTDPMRIPKDAFFVHQVMWDGWVDIEHPRTHIMGHWNYPAETVKSIYVVSNSDRVELFINGKSQGFGKQSHQFLFTFDNIRWEAGQIKAVSYNAKGEETSHHQLITSGEAKNIRITRIESPKPLQADGADLALFEVEVTDAEGRRCPLDNTLVHFELTGEAEWLGGIAQGKDNFILSKDLPVECGVNRVLIRSTRRAGTIQLKATAKGLKENSLSITSQAVEVKNGLSGQFPADKLPCRLERGETPNTPSYTDSKVDVPIAGATAGSNSTQADRSFDDNELSEWSNDGKLSTAWITYELARTAEVDDICIKLTGWRKRSYPIEVYAGKELIWSGETEKSLGYIHLNVKPVQTKHITIRLKGATMEKDAFGQITELDPTQELDLFRVKGAENSGNELRIVEIEFLETLNR